MIAVRYAKRELRPSDKKRHRLILSMTYREGIRSWHLTREEARKLAKDILRLTNIAQDVPLPFSWAGNRFLENRDGKSKDVSY